MSKLMSSPKLWVKKHIPQVSYENTHKKWGNYKTTPIDYQITYTPLNFEISKNTLTMSRQVKMSLAPHNGGDSMLAATDHSFYLLYSVMRVRIA